MFHAVEDSEGVSLVKVLADILFWGGEASVHNDSRSLLFA